MCALAWGECQCASVKRWGFTSLRKQLLVRGDGGVAGAQGTSVVTVEGQGSQLVTTKSTNDGGRIRVGEGLSYSELNIENGGAARATSALGATDTSNDGSLWVGSSPAAAAGILRCR